MTNESLKIIERIRRSVKVDGVPLTTHDAAKAIKLITSLTEELVEARKALKNYTSRIKRDCNHDDPSWCTETCNDHGASARFFFNKYPNERV